MEVTKMPSTLGGWSKWTFLWGRATTSTGGRPPLTTIAAAPRAPAPARRLRRRAARMSRPLPKVATLSPGCAIRPLRPHDGGRDRSGGDGPGGILQARMALVNPAFATPPRHPRKAWCVRKPLRGSTSCGGGADPISAPVGSRLLCSPFVCGVCAKVHARCSQFGVRV